LVVVIGRKLFRGNLADADKAIFGYMLGQDLTDRQQQLTGGQPLLSKSHPRFAATGPWITTVDELTDGVKNVHLETRVNGVRKQSGRLGQMTWDPVTAVHYIADSVPLLPGDLIFMGTPGGVGYAHSPKQFLKPDDFVDSIADELGVLNVSCVGTDVGFDQANRSLGVLI
jgi:2-keto-4-pentenoate hydratase/2-oxohepta-3-ene-1,7-dioic acid hydratase in catechol pathway